MKIEIRDFKGTAPKFGSRSLPDRHGQSAINCRLISNDLEPYLGVSDVLTLGKTGPVNTIYPIDRLGENGGPFFLHWQDSEAPTGVEVAKGFTKDDNGTERVYFTGTDRPRVTNLSLATSGGGSSYPIASRYLGLPIPADAPSAVAEISSSATPQFVLDSLGDFDIEYAEGGSISRTGSEIFLETEGQDRSTAVLTKDVGFTSSNAFKITADLEAITPNVNNLSAFCISAGGANLLITHSDSDDELRFDFNTSSRIRIGPSGGFGRPNTIKVSNLQAYQEEASTLITNTILFGDVFSVELNFSLAEIVNGGAGVERKYNSIIRFYNSGGTEILEYVHPVPVTVVSDEIGFSASAQVGEFGDPEGGSNRVSFDEIEVTLAGTDEGTSLSSFVYTFINIFGEESAPSSPSSLVAVGEDLEVTISGFSTDTGNPASPASANYGIIGYRLYRAVTGTLDTQYQLTVTADYTTVSGIVDVLPTATSSTIDLNLDDELGEVLQSEEWIEPPTDSRNIVALPNGIMALSSGNLVCFSEQFRPHAYPERYKLPTDFPVIAMSAIETTLIVMTQESTYIAMGSDPATMSMSVISSKYPCISRRSVARWGEFGVVYACKQGLVAITSSGAKLVTEGFITDREWANYYPDTIQGVVYEDVYFGFYIDNSSDLHCISFDLRNGGIGFVEIDLESTASFSEGLTETLYVVQNDNELKSWNTGDALEYEWKSKDYLLPYPTSFECAQVKGRVPDDFDGPITVNFYADQSGTPFHSQSVDSDLEFLLPAVVCRELEVELVGSSRINQIVISTSMEELD